MVFSKHLHYRMSKVSLTIAVGTIEPKATKLRQCWPFQGPLTTGKVKPKFAR